MQGYEVAIFYAGIAAIHPAVGDEDPFRSPMTQADLRFKVECVCLKTAGLYAVAEGAVGLLKFKIPA